MVTGFIAGVLLLIGYMTHAPYLPPMILYLWGVLTGRVIPVRAEFLRIWLYGSLSSLGLAILTEQLCVLFLSLTPERLMLMAENKRLRQKLRRQKISFLPSRSQSVVGVSGGGKSAFIGRSMEEIIIDDIKNGNHSMLVIVDGKGSSEKYSLHYSATLLSQKYDVPLTLINCSGNKKLGGIVYDFLDGVTSANAAKELIMTLIDDPLIQASAGSEHYRTMTVRYLLEIIDCFHRFNIDVTLHNVLTFSAPDDLEAVLTSVGAPQDEICKIKEFADYAWPSVRDNIEKLRIYLKAEGAELG